MSRFFAAWYDPVMRPVEFLGFARVRRRLVEGLSGRVLEVGVGSGLTLPHYAAGVEVVGLDPEPAMLGRARRRAARSAALVRLVRGDAQAMPFPDHTFDAAVLTLTLCTIPSPVAALEEVRRVVRPGGEVRALDHVRVDVWPVAWLQRLLTPAWKRVAGGCHLDRDSPGAFRAAGLAVEAVRPLLGGFLLEVRGRVPDLA